MLMDLPLYVKLELREITGKVFQSVRLSLLYFCFLLDKVLFLLFSLFLIYHYSFHLNKEYLGQAEGQPSVFLFWHLEFFLSFYLNKITVKSIS